jgi:predicted component of type VI protein secretion system
VSSQHEAADVSRLELWRATALVDVFPLGDAETTIGRSPSNDVCIEDHKVSRQHAIVQRTGGAGYRITDLDSTNGTFVNDQRVRADRPLRDRDRIRIGDAELVFCAASGHEKAGRTVIEVVREAPDVTRRERDVLASLCRPLFGQERFRLPATTKQISADLVISESAVRHHLDRLYDKFEIYDDDPDERRRLLAVEAIQRGVVDDIGGGS